MASPAESSAALLMRRPEEILAKLSSKSRLERPKFRTAAFAETLVDVARILTSKGSGKGQNRNAIREFVAVRAAQFTAPTAGDQC